MWFTMTVWLKSRRACWFRDATPPPGRGPATKEDDEDPALRSPGRRLDRSLAFYTAVGYEVVGRVPGDRPLTMLKLPRIRIELVQWPSGYRTVAWPAVPETGIGRPDRCIKPAGDFLDPAGAPCHTRRS